MLRWTLTPLTMVTLGLGLGLFTFRLDLTGRVFDLSILIPLIIVAAVLAYLTTIALLRVDRNRRISLRDHPRHMWIVYPLWMFTSLALGGGHGAILFIFPFAALSGVMLGNFLAIVRTVRATA